MPISPVPPLTPMTRDQIMARARFWVDQDVHYFTRDGHRPAEALDPDGQPYRTDCSGYVAMAWQAGTQPSTSEFDLLGHEISVDELLPGDACCGRARAATDRTAAMSCCSAAGPTPSNATTWPTSWPEETAPGS